MVPGALWVSPARPATSTSGAGDLGGAFVVPPAAALAVGEGGHLRVQDRSWFSGQVSRQSPVLSVLSTCRGVRHAPFISVPGPLSVAGVSR